MSIRTGTTRWCSSKAVNRRSRKFSQLCLVLIASLLGLSPFPRMARSEQQLRPINEIEAAVTRVVWFVQSLQALESSEKRLQASREDCEKLASTALDESMRTAAQARFEVLTRAAAERESGHDAEVLALMRYAASETNEGRDAQMTRLLLLYATRTLAARTRIVALTNLAASDDLFRDALQDYLLVNCMADSCGQTGIMAEEDIPQRARDMMDAATQISSALDDILGYQPVVPAIEVSIAATALLNATQPDFDSLLITLEFVRRLSFLCSVDTNVGAALLHPEFGVLSDRKNASRFAMHDKQRAEQTLFMGSLADARAIRAVAERVERLESWCQDFEERLRGMQIQAATNVSMLRGEIGQVRQELLEMLRQLSERVDTLEQRVEALEALQIGAGPALSLNGDEADLDRDGIVDRWESELLTTFAPVLRLDRPVEGPLDGVGVPVSATKFVALCNVVAPSGEVVQPEPTLESLQQMENVEAAKDFKLQFKIKEDAWRFSWTDAIKLGQGVYGRVWRPWGRDVPVVSVQYYILLTRNWSDTDKPFAESGGGDHEGDWLCCDLNIDIEHPTLPRVISAIIHNHGRQLFLKAAAMEFEKDDGRFSHPILYLEWGSNEPWPNSGGSGEGGWPNRDGFATNNRFIENYAGVKLWDEDEVVSSHLGKGNVWKTWKTWESGKIPNLGEFHANQWHPFTGRGELPPNQKELRAVMLWPGFWGGRSNDVIIHGMWAMGRSDVVYKVEPPRGPAFNEKMWNRTFDKNVWADGPIAASDGQLSSSPGRSF